MKSQAVWALNFLKSRQERSDLRYWLGLVNYDPDERGFTNRVYLVYLILFFTLWFFIVFIFLARSLLRFLPFFGEIPTLTLVCLGMLLSFCLVSLVTLLPASARSPLIFTEEQRHLLCQQPIPPRPLVFRWITVPWLVNFLIFSVPALVFGFVYAETLFPPEKLAAYLPLYVWYGLRVLLLTLPFHLASFLNTWAAGIVACRQRGSLVGWIPTALTILLTLAALLGFALPSLFGVSLPVLGGAESFLSNLLMAFFGAGTLGFGRTFLIGIGLCLPALLFLWLAAGNFSPAKAAAESEKAARVSALTRYAQFDALRQYQKQQRLGIFAKTRFQPDWQNEKSFLWKALVQSGRDFSFASLWQPLSTFSLVLSLGFFGNAPVLWFALAGWVWMLSRHALRRFQGDLEFWQLTRQTPVPLQKWGSIDLLLPVLPHLAAIVLGLIVDQIFFKPDSLLFLLIFVPGLIAAQFQQGAELLRQSRAEALANAAVPGTSLRGLVLAWLCLQLPLTLTLLPLVPLNWFLAAAAALALAFFSRKSFLKQIESLFKRR